MDVRSPSNASVERRPPLSLISSASPANFRHDSKDSLQNSSPGQPPQNMLPNKPSLQDESRRTSFSGKSSIPSYVSTGPALSMQGSIGSPSMSQRSMYSYRRNASMSYTGSLSSARTASRVPTAMPENDYLGFCKGAWKLQNGDRKGSMEKRKEATGWSRNSSRSTTLAQYLECAQTKCAFRSNFISSDSELIFDKVMDYPEKGVKIRWKFLAKSHVPQKVVLSKQYAFKCLFCVFMGLGGCAGFYMGIDYYLDHLNLEHRGQAMGEVLLFKTSCINERIADNTEEFDVNLWPLDMARDDAPADKWLSDGLLGAPLHMHRLPLNDAISANQPWVVDASLFEDFDTSADDNSDDGKATVTTAIYRPSTSRATSLRRTSVQSDAMTAVPTNFASPPLVQSPGKFTYEEWEDNPEEIWGANKKTPENEEDAQLRQPPNIPIRSGARLTANRESRDAPELVHPALRQSHAQGSSLQSREPSIGPDQWSFPGDLEPAVTNCLKTIIEAFEDSAAVLEGLKREPALAEMQLLPILGECIQEAPVDIDREWQRGFTRCGITFEVGDHIAINALQKIAITLHNRLTNTLRILAAGRPTNLAQLIDLADTARHEVISILHDLRRRLMQGVPHTLLSSMGKPGRMMWPDPSVYEDYTPRSASRSAPRPSAQPSQSHTSQMRPDLWKDPYFPEKVADPQNTSVSSKELKHSRAQSDVTAETNTRRLSVLNNFSKSKWARKISVSSTRSQASKSSEDASGGQATESIKGGLKLRTRRKTDPTMVNEEENDDDDGGGDGPVTLAELDSTPVVNV